MSKTNTVKIIGGQYSRRSISFIQANGLRPSPVRVRETLFNWLQFELNKACVLDLFAGSGVLGFEALSRGASKITLVENNQKTYTQILQNAKQFNTKNIRIIQDDAGHYLEQLSKQAEPTAFDYIFLDPPFGQQYLNDILTKINQAGVLNLQGKIYIETELTLNAVLLPNNMSFLKQKKAGNVHYGLIGLSQ